MDEKSKLRLQSLRIREWEEDGNQITGQQRVRECIHGGKRRKIYEKL